MASFYVERIDLASKLRKFGPKWQWNLSFSVKKSPYNFSNADPSNLIISKLTHFKQTFSLQNKKITYSTTLKAFSLYFKFHLILKELPLNFLFFVRFFEVFFRLTNPCSEFHFLPLPLCTHRNIDMSVNSGDAHLRTFHLRIMLFIHSWNLYFAYKNLKTGYLMCYAILSNICHNETYKLRKLIIIN